MDDPAAVRVVEPGAGLDPDLGRRLGIDRPVTLQQLRAGAPGHVLHDDVVAAVVDARVVDLDDVGVDQLRDGERLATEAGDEAVVVGEVLGEDLHRDGALEDAVGRFVDVRHPARAEALAGFVAAREGSGLHQSSFHRGAGADAARGPPSPGGVTSSPSFSLSSPSGPLPDSSPSSGGPGCSASFSAFSWAFSSRSSFFSCFSAASSPSFSSASRASCSSASSASGLLRLLLASVHN